MMSCEVCGSVEDLIECCEIGNRKMYACRVGRCIRELERDAAEVEEQEYQRDLADLNARYGRRW